MVRESVYDAYGKLTHYRPRLLLISNQGGARINAAAVKTAANLGVRVVSLVSEGDYPDDDDELVRRFFWGWNADLRFYEDVHLEWTQRAVDLIHRAIPDAVGFDIRVTGATGFDRFRLMAFGDCDALLTKYGLPPYERIVGMAGWTFDHVSGSYYENHREVVTRSCGGDAGVELHARARTMLRGMLREVISSRRETLFVLKHHPGVTDESLSEFWGLEDLENVLILRGHGDNVADVIGACDLWLAYESTTCLEAWLLGKQTLLVNPAGADFRRSPVSAGSPVVETVGQLAFALDEFYRTGEVPGWRDREAQREGVVERTIGWADGMSHARAGECARETLEVGPREALGDEAYLSGQRNRSRRLRTLRRSGLIRLDRYAVEREQMQRMEERFDVAMRAQRAAEYRAALDAYYSAAGIDIRRQSPVDCPGREGV